MDIELGQLIMDTERDPTCQGILGLVCKGFAPSIVSLCIVIFLIILYHQLSKSQYLALLSSRCSDISSVCGPPIFPHWITAFATPLIAKFSVTPFFYTNTLIAKISVTPFLIQIP